MNRTIKSMLKELRCANFSILLITSCLVIFAFNITPADAQIIFEDDFETGVFERDKWDLTWWTDRQLPEGIEPEIVTSPVRAGKYAVKMRAEYHWNGVIEYNRTELQARRIDNGDHISFFDVNGEEYWMGFSAYLPTSWVIDSQPELIYQLHGNGSGRPPPFALYINGDKWGWRLRWQPNRDESESGSGETELWQGTYEKEKWVDWVIHAIWSYKEDGFLEIFKDGALVVKRKGPNCYNDAAGMRGPQTGIYKWGWREVGPSDVNERIVYLDEFKVGGKNSSYTEIAPAGGVLKNTR